MKTAILIHAHKNPQQVARLCRALRHPDFDTFLNVDAKSDLDAFRRAIPDVRHIQNRVKVYWGDFSQVRATLNALEEILDGTQTYDFVMFVSGQDYPLVPMSEIARQLRQNPGRQFMNWRKIERHDPENRFLCRHAAPENHPINRRINQLIRRCGFPRQPVPFPAVYKGSSWWTLSGACARYVVAQARDNPKIVQFFSRTHCPDEMFFQTVVLNSGFADSVISPNRRYVDWSEHKSNPKILTAADYTRIIESDAWFARKFDADVDAQILDMLDRHIAERTRAQLR